MKRYQVNLPLWLSDYLEKLAPHYEMSISEFLRFYITVGVVNVIDNICPEFDRSLLLEDAPEHKEKLLMSNDEERIRWFEEFYFEAQRAVKHRKTNDPLFKE
jgi:hypothetical protein